MSPASSPELLVLHGLRLLGIADVPALARWWGVEEDVVADAVRTAHAADQIEERFGRFAGFRLTDAGTTRAAALVAAEVDARGVRDTLEDVYARFTPLNGQLLDICTRWQLKGSGAAALTNAHDDATYDAGVIGDLVALHEEARPVIADAAAALARFAGHAGRLAEAITRVQAGQVEYLTTPMFPSYHSVWFELHEDFLATLGIERNPGR